MKLSAFALAAVVAFAASTANSATIYPRYAGSFNGTCGPMHFNMGDPGHADYVTSTDVSYDSVAKAWGISHHMSSGRTYWRGNQYNVTPGPDNNYTGWYGSRFSNPAIGMTGNLFVWNGHVWYSEAVYRLSNGNATAKVASTTQDCGPMPVSVPSPVPQQPAPTAPVGPDPGALSTYLGM
jgi:hypothetical protein